MAQKGLRFNTATLKWSTTTFMALAAVPELIQFPHVLVVPLILYKLEFRPLLFTVMHILDMRLSLLACVTSVKWLAS